MAVAPDPGQAAQWYRRAAEGGSPVAQSQLAGVYESGIGVEQSGADALRWYRLAAQQGEIAALNGLADLYRGGRDVPRDGIVAYALYEVSLSRALRGNGIAQDRRNRVAETLSAAEIGAARKLARQMSRPGELLQALDRYLGCGN